MAGRQNLRDEICDAPHSTASQDDRARLRQQLRQVYGSIQQHKLHPGAVDGMCVRVDADENHSDIEEVDVNVGL